MSTFDIGEVYWVSDEVWEGAGLSPYDCLCVGCLEVRLGRELGPVDFIAIASNYRLDDKSDRLLDRLGDTSWMAATVERDMDRLRAAVASAMTHDARTGALLRAR